MYLSFCDEDDIEKLNSNKFNYLFLLLGIYFTCNNFSIFLLLIIKLSYELSFKDSDSLKIC